MRAICWRGGTLGIRVGKANAHRFFDRTWSIVEVEMDARSVPFPLSKNFWTTCPEIRGASIRSWLRAHGLDTWVHGHPPKVELTPLDGNRFRLSQI